MTAPRTAVARPWDAVLVALFVLVISLPMAANIAGMDGADPRAENRELARPPHLDGSIESIATFASRLGRWFEDHFGFRSTLVRWYAESRFFWFGVSPSASVIKGRDGWLFYADDGGLEDATNAPMLSPVEVEDWRETLTRVHAWLRARGVAYVFTIAPDKPLIYPEGLPTSLRRVHDTSRMDQVEAMLARHPEVPNLDVRPALRDAKARERIYFKTDTHWNDRGALVAYQQIIDAVRRQAPSVPPAWTRDDFEPIERVMEGGDLARMMGLMRELPETHLTFTLERPRRAAVVEPRGVDASAEEGRLVTEIAGSTLPRAVIFRDSFASRLAPFLSEHFSRAVYLWQNDFDAGVVLRERPDVVIQVIVSRHLYVFTPSPELIPR